MRVDIVNKVPAYMLCSDHSLRHLKRRHQGAKCARPNLTRLIVGGTAGDSGLPYPVMEFLDGETLRDLVQEEHQLPLRGWPLSARRGLHPAQLAHHGEFVTTRSLELTQTAYDMRPFAKDLMLAESDRMAAAGVSRQNSTVDGENYASTLIPPSGHGPRHPAR
ncbi:hypothetical protein ACFQ8O_14180 [Streptomyces coelicoflavus]|uniref:hypothetical protein n=1 Tax=Streptomyces coelicoflavus TaxID=285562 RepID=UPI0036809AA4